MAEEEKKMRKRLVLFPLPLQGHINPMLQLAKILHSKGFSITIIHTKVHSPDPSKHPLFSFHSIPDGLSETEANMDNVIAFLSLLNVKCVAPFTDCLANLLSDHSKEQEEEVEEEVEEESIPCLITDAMWHFTQAIAVRFNLPRIVLRTSSVCSFLAFAAFPLLNHKGYLPLQESHLEEPIPELPPLKVKDIPDIKTLNQEDFHLLLSRMMQATKASSGSIWNTFEELELSALTTCHQDFPIRHFPLGPFHKHFPATSGSLIAQDQTCISWLNAQLPNSVLYVSFGSLAALHEPQFLEIALGLANSGQPFLWVVRPGLVHGSSWVEPLPDRFIENLSGRGHIVKWAPQQEVLAHPAVGGFWTHCGWNSTMESICEGVPMICLPFFGDQKVNARYVSHVWRVGLNLEWRLERNEIERAIKKVLVEEEGMEMREKILALKEKAHVCMKKGGSAYQSLETLVNYILSF